MPLGSYRIAAVGAQLGVGAVGSVYLTIDAVGKANGPSAPYCVPNELICGEIGRFLRLPIPPGGIVTSAHHAPMFASLNFNIAGVALPPVDPAECVRLLPDLSTGLLLFDILIANPDRHGTNFSLNTLAQPAQMNVFDHSHALLGHQAGQAEARLTGLFDQLGIGGHCLLATLSDSRYFERWMARIRALPDFLIEDVCADATIFGMSEAESAAVQTFLKARRDTFTDLINRHRSEFPAIQPWTLV